MTRFEIPAKTFLLGEYAVLENGPALIYTSTPVFQFYTTPCDRFILEGIPSKSPAGKLIADHQERFEQIHIRFIDPYQAQGGLGASTAQFLGVYQTLYDENLPRLLNLYQQYAWNGKGYPPSGADLIAQTQQDIVFYQTKPFCLRIFTWPFSEASCLLLRTGTKLPTHTHLLELKEQSFTELSDLVYEGFEAFKKADLYQFVNTMTQYASTLEQLDLTAQHTLALLKTFKHRPWIPSCKRLWRHGR